MGQGSSIAVSCGVGHRPCLDPMLLWLWCRPVAIPPIQALAWEFPYAALKSKKKKKQKTKELHYKLVLIIVDKLRMTILIININN